MSSTDQQTAGTAETGTPEAAVPAEHEVPEELALAAELARQAQVPVTVRHDAALARPADPPALVGNPLRLREATGFIPEIPFERSLGDLLESWRTPQPPAA